MLLDNKDYSAKEGRNHPSKVFNFFRKYLTEKGKFNAVTGYFSPSGLARFHEHFDEFVEEYNLVIGELATNETVKEKVYQLLSDNYSLKNGVNSLKDAGSAIQFLKQEKVKVKTLRPNFCHAKAYLYKEKSNDPQKNFFVVGSSNMTEAGMGLKFSSNIELNNADFGGNNDYAELQKWFKDLWEHPEAKDKILIDGREKDFKEYLIGLMQDYHRKYTPEQLYYKVLYELFKKDIFNITEDSELQQQLGSLENTVIFQTLYNFQQKGVISLIKMLKNLNGAILADGVGLGKTWQALAVMKFFQMRNYEVVLLCPKRLHRNWVVYQKKRGSKFENDRLEYVIRWHTDLQDDRIGNKDDGLRLDEYFQSDRPKLLVIDESHNLRNNSSQRYKFLMNEIIKKNQDIKVLLLSATPINTKLTDVLNQFMLITKDNSHAFKKSLGIFSIRNLFAKANRAFIKWTEDPDSKLDDLINELNDNLLQLTDKLIVARTREFVRREGLVFPKNNGTENMFLTPENIGNIKTFDEFFNALPDHLAAYKPVLYTVEPTKKLSAIEDARIQDTFLIKMMHILLTKRFESSWKSLQSTINVLLSHHENALEKATKFKSLNDKRNGESSKIEVDYTMGMDEEETDDFTLGKREIKLADIQEAGKLDLFIEHLNSDVKKLTALKNNLQILQEQIEDETEIESKDNKLEALLKIIQAKQNAETNNKNHKLVVFTTFSDTAMYLYEELKKRGFKRMAVVTGTSIYTYDQMTKFNDFEPVLQRFAPFTKLFNEKNWPDFERNDDLTDLENFKPWKDYIKLNKPEIFNDKLQKPIDILIATDCLSEGQNLQDADMVINYDIHWNPVRLIQRFGRIDRIGSPNTIDGITAVNFWPVPDLNSYLRLQKRIEDRAVAMTLAGTEINAFEMENKGEKIKEIQQDRMLRQMKAKIEDVEDDNNLSFADLSMETFRQELYDLLKSKQKEMEAIPNGVFTGFQPKTDMFVQTIPEGMIALMGYPAKKSGVVDHVYTEYHLAYLRNNGEIAFKNRKEILTILKSQRSNPRILPKGLDSGDEKVLKHYSGLLLKWLDDQTKTEITNTVNDILDGNVEQEKAFLDKKFQPENFDLICWFAIKN